MSNYTAKTSVPVTAIPVTGTVISNQSTPVEAREVPFQPNFTSTFGSSSISPLQVQCYSLRKTVTILCGIDIFFSLLYSIYNPYFIISTLIACFGFYGAKNYNSCMIFSYFLYITLDWIAKLVVYSIDVVNQDPTSSNGLMWSFVILTTIVNMWISKIVYKYWRCLKEITLLELAELKTLQLGRYYYVYW